MFLTEKKKPHSPNLHTYQKILTHEIYIILNTLKTNGSSAKRTAAEQ